MKPGLGGIPKGAHGMFRRSRNTLGDVPDLSDSTHPLEAIFIEKLWGKRLFLQKFEILAEVVGRIAQFLLDSEQLVVFGDSF